MNEITCHSDCLQALSAIKQRTQTSRSCAAPAMNAELLNQSVKEKIESELVWGNRGLPSND